MGFICVGGFGARALRITLHFLAIGAAANIIFLTAFYLSRITFTNGQQASCLLDGYSGFTNDRICGITYTLAAVTIVASLFILTLSLLSLFGFFIADFVDGILSSFLAFLWLGAAIALTIFVVEANRKDFPRESFRNLVLFLFYATFLIFFINIWTSLACCCARKRTYEDEEVVTRSL